MRWLRVLWVFGVLVGTAHAQTATEVAAAKERFADGLAKEKAGNCKEAIGSFRAAGAIKQTPQILYHLGHCEKETGLFVEALVDLQRAVDLGRQNGVTEVEAAAKPEIEAVQAKVGKLDVKLPEGHEPTKATLDGTSIAVSALRLPLMVNPGEHELVVGFGSANETQKVSVGEGATVKVTINAPPAAPAEEPPAPSTIISPNPTPAPPASPPSSPEPPPSSSKVPYVLIIGGAPIAIAGVVLFALGQSTASDIENQCKNGFCPKSLEADYDSGKMQHTLGLVLGGVGLAAAAVGVVMLVGGAKPSTTAQHLMTGRF